MERFPTQEKGVPVLSEKDKRVLQEAGAKVIDMLLRDFPEELPKAIIFPDTSARPLAHMFMPVMRKIAHAREQAVPSIYFFQQHHDAEPNKERAQEISNFEGDTSKLQDFLRKILFDKRTNMAIIDDYVSMEANTIGTIRKAFGTNDIPAYALIGEVNYFPDAAKIQVGLLDPYASRPGRISNGFEYRRTDGIGVQKSPDSIHAAKVETSSPDVQALRAEMKKLGETIALNF